jgi:hypothetical protein
MAAPFHTDGRTFGQKIVDANTGASVPRMRLHDKRCTLHDTHRFNLSLHPQLSKKRKPATGPRGGSQYADNLGCPKCKKLKTKADFINYSVRPDTRKHDGFNVMCRDCQTRQYSHGYKLDDFVAPPDEEITDDTESESEVDEVETDSAYDTESEDSVSDSGDDTDSDTIYAESEPESESETYDVEAIVGHRIHNGRKEFFTKWEGYPDSERTWEPYENFINSDGSLCEAFETYIFTSLTPDECATILT